jgi:2-polyprenyl-3-methyl-5-hydroxy-6-metoxy-1,4-benzoquinol methylase
LFEHTGAGTAASADPLAGLPPIMQAAGVTLDAAGFRAAVNSAFHAAEAHRYDKHHSDMWESLPQQFQLLAADFLSQYPPPNPKMSALDLGCGTGLAADLILKTRLGAFVRQFDLADPVQEMLDIAGARESIRSVRHRLIRGTIQSLPAGAGYDLVVACSVLKHVAGLPEVLREIALRQPPGALFLHLEDANFDYRDDLEQSDRVERVRSTGQARAARLLRRLSGGSAIGSTAVNVELVRREIVSRELTDAEIRTVVDLCVHQGWPVSMPRMAALLPEYELVSCRSYAFFGELISELSSRYRTWERALIAAQAPNGSRIGAIWRKKEQV